MSGDLNYFAGLMDSDGWFGKCDVVSCACCNTDKRPLEIFTKLWWWTNLLPSPRKPQHKPCWKWQISDHKEGSVLPRTAAPSFVRVGGLDATVILQADRPVRGSHV